MCKVVFPWNDLVKLECVYLPRSFGGWGVPVRGETCGAADVLFVVRSINILFDRGAYLLKNSPVSEMRKFFLVHLRSVLFMLLERARLWEYDLWATRPGMFLSPILLYNRSEMHGILK